MQVHILMHMGIGPGTKGVRMKPKVLSVDKIWDYAEHNAFPDLIYYQGRFLCCFRESDTHASHEDGKVRILESHDGKTWASAALLAFEGVDLRDPKLSEMPDGRLMLLMGGSIYRKKRYMGCKTRVAFSSDGMQWTAIATVELPEEWIWRISWHKGIGYGVSYRLTNIHSVRKPWILTLFQTTNGIDYTPITQLDVKPRGNETTLRFTPDDTMIAMVRRDGTGLIGSAPPPYTQWRWFETGYRFGGPNFLILPNGKMWAGSRLVRHARRKRQIHTALAKMGLASYEPVLVLPSSGDTSYPGMVYHNNLLYMTYYSTHEEKTMIYMAKIVLGEQSGT